MTLSLRLFPFAFFVAATLHAAPPVCETWQSGYSGNSANGPQVLGYWRFDDPAPLADSSSRKNDLKLAGAQFSAEGRHGGALESFAGWPVIDARHAALGSNAAALSPRGAFTIDLWLKAKPELTPELSPVLIDKKYVAHTDYQFRLTRGDKSGARRLEVILGFGDDSATFDSEQFKLEPGVWQHVAFTYDAAGEVRFYRNGAPLGSIKRPGRGPIAPGKHALSIGDRVGSNYAGFPGYLDDVRISDGVLEFRPISVAFDAERWTWLRMEKAQPLRVQVSNLTNGALKAVDVRIAVSGLGEKRAAVDELKAGEKRTIEYAIDTALRPGQYDVTAKVTTSGDMPYASEERASFTIAPRRLPRMPVMMWGIGSPASVEKEMPRLKEIGFTHCLGGGADYDAIWQAKAPTDPLRADGIENTRRMLDFALANNFGIAFTLSPGGWLKGRPELQRIDRSGKPYGRSDVNASLPGLTVFCENVGASIAKTYHDFPAWQAVLVNTEARDDSQVSFSEFDRDACRKATGADIPAGITSKSGVDWTKVKDFPSDRIIRDDDPMRRFYRWFWTTGDGWNALHTAVHRGVHSAGRDDVWTWFDPAIRAPSIAGSGGNVDVLSQWTYSYPDPLRIGYFADELFAMARESSPAQRVMKMTQLIWYRSRTAPKKTGPNQIGSPFDDHDPDAAYITIAPMHLREAFWTKIARPVSGIMYHGWESLVPTESTGAYRYTNPDTQHELKRLLHGVVEPLGPTLVQVPDRQSDVAYLDSFTSQMFARRGSYGYGSDEAYLTVLYAHLQPQVLQEDDVTRDGLTKYKVLVLADCDVLPASVAAKILEFQKSGGVIVGDENLAPGVKADITIPKVKRTDKADADKATLLANAALLRKELDAHYRRYVDTSTPDIVPRCRTAGDADYVFVVNDRREFGEYVGQHGLVMENGVPAEGEVSIAREKASVYDLLGHRAMKTTVQDGKLRWRSSLAAAEGSIYLVTSRPITEVHIASPETIGRGNSATFSLGVLDDAGKAVDAVIPVQVEISDPAGRVAEFSGYHAANHGQLALQIDIAKNDASGWWQMRVRELASGLEDKRAFRVVP